MDEHGSGRCDMVLGVEDESAHNTLHLTSDGRDGSQRFRVVIHPSRSDPPEPIVVQDRQGRPIRPSHRAASNNPKGMRVAMMGNGTTEEETYLNEGKWWLSERTGVRYTSLRDTNGMEPTMRIIHDDTERKDDAS
jgi:hypothetical protein